MKEYYAERSDVPARIHTFASAYDLLESADDDAGFELYILDVVMPEMTGIEVGAKLREAERLFLVLDKAAAILTERRNKAVSVKTELL